MTAVVALGRRTRSRGAFASRFLRNRGALFSLVFLVVLVAGAIAAPLITWHDPNAQSLRLSLESPGGTHWLGTDLFGRDIWSRLVYGARVSLVAGVQASLVATVLGSVFGLFAGYYRGWIDRVFSFVSNAILSVPGIVLAIAVVASLGPGLTNAMLAIGIVMSPRFFRLVRSLTIEIKAEPFVAAARSCGCRGRRVMFAHILPNILPALFVQVTFVLGTAILAEASLSYLGLGANPPTPSWGSMLSEASDRLDRPHLLWPAGILLSVTVLAFALVGDGLRDAIKVSRGGN